MANINILTDINRVKLVYRTRDRGGEWQTMNYPVRVSWTSCNYGGQRAWWHCPAVGCGRRVAVLYGGKVYACRHCHQLAYRTQRENAADRAGNRADKLRDRLGWEAGILNGNGSKPKGMHWRTFERLEASHDALVNQSLVSGLARFGARVNSWGGDLFKLGCPAERLQCGDMLALVSGRYAATQCTTIREPLVKFGNVPNPDSQS